MVTIVASSPGKKVSSTWRGDLFAKITAAAATTVTTTTTTMTCHTTTTTTTASTARNEFAETVTYHQQQKSNAAGAGVVGRNILIFSPTRPPTHTYIHTREARASTQYSHWPSNQRLWGNNRFIAAEGSSSKSSFDTNCSIRSWYSSVSTVPPR